jgi:hypothetical protein
MAEQVEQWFLSCPEHWEVTPANDAASEAVKLRGEWPKDAVVVPVSDYEKLREAYGQLEEERDGAEAGLDVARKQERLEATAEFEAFLDSASANP